MPKIELEVDNCNNCPLCDYQWEYGTYLCRYISVPLGKATDEEMMPILEWKGGKPEFCPAKEQ